MASASANSAIASIGLTPVTKAASATLTAKECRGTLINTFGQTAEINLILCTAAKGLNLRLIVGTSGAGAVNLKFNSADKIYLIDQVLEDGEKVRCATPVVGDMISAIAFQTGVDTYDWKVDVISGTWTVMTKYEYFTTYTEVDPGGVITVTDNKIEAVAIPSTPDAYLYKDFGAAYFSTYFDIRFKVNLVSASGSDANLGAICLANSLGNTTDIANSLYLQLYAYSSHTNIILVQRRAGAVVATSDIEDVGTYNTNFWIKLVREVFQSKLYAYIYTDEFITLRKTLVVNLTDAGEDFRYLLTAQTSGNSSKTATVTIENMEIVTH
ncbi:MAG: hypothetical protein JEZ11_24690 [Desulfobacterales bacterium]|nr:hypothetical protein [Desulfobacterales bacterium]